MASANARRTCGARDGREPGIGEAIARRFAAEGALVGITARTKEEGDHRFSGSIATTLATIRDAGGAAFAVPADLSRVDDRVRVVEAVSGEFGPIDVLVNNAAITYFGPLARVRPAPLAAHVRRPGARAVPPVPARHPRDAVGTSRLDPEHLVPGCHPSGWTALRRRWAHRLRNVQGRPRALVDGPRLELYDDGIAVNALSPTGLVVTPGVVHHELDKRIPKERHESVDVMSEAALLLCSHDPRAVTGRIASSQSLLGEFALEA